MSLHDVLLLTGSLVCCIALGLVDPWLVLAFAGLMMMKAGGV
jgi:hypothetical protein